MGTTFRYHFPLNIRVIEFKKTLTKVFSFSFKAEERKEAISAKKGKNSNFMILLVFHCKISKTIDVASKALHSEAVNYLNAPEPLQVCLVELEKY